MATLRLTKGEYQALSMRLSCSDLAPNLARPFWPRIFAMLLLRIEYCNMQGKRRDSIQHRVMFWLPSLGMEGVGESLRGLRRASEFPLDTRRYSSNRLKGREDAP